MPQPWYQKLSLPLVFIVGGLLLLGNFLDAIGNAFSLVTPPVTYTGTALLLFGWPFTELLLRLNPLRWETEEGEQWLTHLPSKTRWGLLGVLLLLWLPRVITGGDDNSRRVDQPVPDSAVTADESAGTLPHLDTIQAAPSVAGSVRVDTPRVESSWLRAETTGRFFDGDLTVSLVAMNFVGSPLRHVATVTLGSPGRPAARHEAVEIGQRIIYGPYEIHLENTETFGATVSVRLHEPRTLEDSAAPH